MDANTLVILAIVVLVVIAILAFAAARAKKRRRLKDRFGPEYARAVEETGSRRRAESELHEREKRVKRFELHPLAPAERARFTTAWTQVQAEFVDDPRIAVMHADELLNDVMQTRGYPVGDFEQRSADLSVEHPVVVQNYRAARDIALKHKRGDAGTEDLRQAMQHYRALFEELTRTDEAPPPPVGAPSHAPTRH